MTDREHTFPDTNRHVVEVPDTFAIARWRRDADVAAPLPHPATVALLVELRVLSAEAIGKALADNMSEQRFDAAVKAANARYKAKRQKPAG